MISEFHTTPQGGHFGAYRTYRRIASNLYWKGMIFTIQKFVATCYVCQTHKYEAQSSAGLLQPLLIPSAIWEVISIDLITGLLPSSCMDRILVTLDHLSKFVHFISLRHPFTAKHVAEVFSREVVRLYGIPRMIVNDRDPVFVSNFWI